MRSFWQGKKVLLTGHTGFKGSWLALWLQQLGAEVIGYALPAPTKPSLFQEANVAAGMISIEGDIRQSNQLDYIFKRHQPQIVLHLAAQALVRYSYENPAVTYETNVMGLVHLLEAVRQTPSVQAVLIVTSDKCYENKEWLWGYRENEAMGGHDPYSSSKGCAELVTAGYRRSFFADGPPWIATARAGNVIGGGDWSTDRLIPDLIRAFRKGQSVFIRYPRAVRPWQHVLECLHGYLMLTQRLWSDGTAFAEAWNFGPEAVDHQPVQRVAETLCLLWGPEARWETTTDPQPHEAQSLRLDHTKARLKLGWRPVLDLSTALQWTAEWYKNWAQGRELRALTEQQISVYEEKLRANGLK